MTYAFSILIVTYNPVWEKLCLTLDSVLAQTFFDYEIIISDDGSKDNLQNEILTYFKEKNFHQFQLVQNETNQGTVKNLLSGINVASGKYIRDFGPGDFFYSKNTLKALYEFMESTGCEACFGMVKGYIGDLNSTYELSDFYHPFDIEAYRNANINRIKSNLVLYRDNPSGASTSYTKDFYLEYLQKIEDHVTYVEDILIVLAAVENRTFAFFEDYLVYYEMKASVVEKNDNFRVLLEKDIVSFYELLYSMYPDDALVKKQHSLLAYYKIHNKYAMALLRFFKNPGMVTYLFSHWLQMKNGSYQINSKEKGFLDK